MLIVVDYNTSLYGKNDHVLAHFHTPILLNLTICVPFLAASNTFDILRKAIQEGTFRMKPECLAQHSQLFFKFKTSTFFLVFKNSTFVLSAVGFELIMLIYNV